MLYYIEIGGLLIQGKTQWAEGATFEYTESGPMLIIALRGLKQSEIEAAKTGQVELAFYETNFVIFIMHKIKGLEQWSDSPFSIRLYENKTFDWSEPIAADQGLGLQIILVDANTGIIKAMRLVGTSTQFAIELRAAIERQWERPFSKETYNQKINEIYQKYTSDDLLKRATARHRI